jgi:hypothetical protein
MQADTETYLQLELWDDNEVIWLARSLVSDSASHAFTACPCRQACIHRMTACQFPKARECEFAVLQAFVDAVAKQIRDAGCADRVILGNPQNANIWKMCGAALPEAPRILPNSEVTHECDRCRSVAAPVLPAYI